jgi:spore coat protein CotF
MLQDKTMVNDALSMAKASLTTYTTAIAECANLELRSALQQIRGNDEKGQYELYKLAESKGFYKPAMMAADQDIQQIKSDLQQG